MEIYHSLGRCDGITAVRRKQEVVYYSIEKVGRAIFLKRCKTYDKSFLAVMLYAGDISEPLM